MNIYIYSKQAFHDHFLNKQLYLSDVWLQTPKRHVLKIIGLHAQNMLIILRSIVKIIEEDLYDHLMSKLDKLGDKK